MIRNLFGLKTTKNEENNKELKTIIKNNEYETEYEHGHESDSDSESDCKESNNLRNKEKITKIIKKCDRQSLYHYKNALIANEWDNMSGIFTVFVTATQALVMTVLTVYESSNVHVTIAGASFAFIIAVMSRIIDASDFQITSYRHNHSADEYAYLAASLRILLDDIETSKYDNATFNQYIIKYTSINEKSHIRPIKYYKFMFCIKDSYLKLNKKSRELSDES